MFFKIHHWPLLLSGWIVATFIISYSIAVALEDVYPFFPYISETGAKPPASCFFGQMMNIAAVLTGIALFLRYVQLDFAIKTNTSNVNKRLNNICYWLGFVVAFGISIVGNFQGDVTGSKLVLGVHVVGALLAFGVGGVYMAIQTKISYDLQPFYDAYPKCAVRKRVQHFRLILTICFVLSFVFVFGFAMAAAQSFTGDRHSWYTHEHGGYGYHLVSTISEWILVLLFLIYIHTVQNELKVLSYEGIIIKRKDEIC